MRWLGAAYVVVAAIYFLAPFEGAAQVGFGNALLTLAPAAALAAAALAWSRAARGARVSWLLIALAAASGLAGQLLWDVHELVLHQPVPFPSPAYFLFMLFHPLLLAGILVSLRAGPARRAGVELATDGAVAWSIITLALLRLLFEPLRAAAPWMSTRDQFYIIGGQIAVHGALVGAGALIVWRDSVLPPRAIAALVAATLANSAANFMSLARLDPDPGRAGDPFDLVWLAGWILVACAGAAGAERGAGAWAGTRATDAARVIRKAVLPASVLLFGVLALDLAVRGGARLTTVAVLALTAVLLAIRAGQALNAAEREQNERSELERTRALVELGRTMTGARGIDGALTSVCEWARRLLAAEDAWIETRDDDGTIRTRGFSRGRLLESTTPLDHSATVWLTGSTQRQVSTGAHAPALHGPGGRAIPARHWVAGTSIRFGDRVLGCLVVAQPDRALTTAETELLGALADQAAIAIENARLVDDARHSERTRLQSEKLATVGQLAAGVAHEINNPLAAIRSAADLLSFAVDAPDDRATVELIQNEAMRAAGIVRGMLDFVHPGDSRATRVEPAELIAATLRLRAYEHGLREITVECDVDGLPALHVDRNRVQQVLLNLIVNAEHAMMDTPRPHVLRVRGTHGADGVTIAVEDTGIGMDAEHLGRVFDPFFTTKDVGEGTGLGLSVSYGIMRELGGGITVTSEPGRGSTFTLRLPPEALDDARADAPAAPADRPREESQPLRVLVIDDERSLRLLLSRYLQRAGHHVALASNGREALDAIAAQPPFDAIVTDLRMPYVDGPQLYLHLAEHRPELVERVIFMSGDTVGQDAREFLAATRRPFLGKPFSLDELGQQIAALARAARAGMA